MKLLFKQRMFTWFDSYDIYDENNNTVFTVKGQFAWGHRLNIYDAQGNHIGTVQQELLTFLPRFALYNGAGNLLGEIKKEFTLFKPVFTLNCNNWVVEGDYFQWEYRVTDGGLPVMQASKQLFNWTDTYVVDVAQPNNALLCLMIVLAIDAAKCSSGNG